MSHLCPAEMRITCLIVVTVSLLCGVESLGLEEASQAGRDTGSQQPLHREKKDIAKLQALFGGWKQPPKPYPILAFEEIKKPVYYVPPLQHQQQQPCNCNWRPSTRYGDGGYPALVIPARPALPAQQQPPVLPALPARQAPLPPVIPASPALVSAADPPCPPEGYHYDRPLHH